MTTSCRVSSYFFRNSGTNERFHTKIRDYIQNLKINGFFSEKNFGAQNKIFDFFLGQPSKNQQCPGKFTANGQRK
jgi:hypothetical protein